LQTPELARTALTIFMAFTTAAAMACLVRHTVYAGILGLGFSLTVVSRIIQVFPDEFANQSLVLITVIIVGTILAWLAVRYDWGFKP
jgi:hypothetical protein